MFQVSINIKPLFKTKVTNSEKNLPATSVSSEILGVKPGEEFEEHKFLKIDANKHLKKEGYGLMKRCIRCGCVVSVNRQTFKSTYYMKSEDYANPHTIKPVCIADKESLDEAYMQMKQAGKV